MDKIRICAGCQKNLPEDNRVIIGDFLAKGEVENIENYHGSCAPFFPESGSDRNHIQKFWYFVRPTSFGRETPITELTEKLNWKPKWYVERYG